MKLFTSLSILVLAISTTTAPAHAAQSWSEQPTWAASANDARGARRPSALTGEGRHVIAPFTPGSNNLSLDVGQVFLIGDLASDYSDNIGSQLHYTYGVSDMFAFDASFGYSSHSEGDYSMMNLSTGVRTNLAWYDKVIPYATFGLGFYKPTYKITPTSTISPVLFGLHLGPGVDLEITRNMFFGASLTFHDMFGTQKLTALGQKEVGGAYTSFFLRAGMTF